MNNAFFTRSVKLTYDSTIKLYDIELYRYTILKNEIESGDVNSNNKGFCVTGPDKKCLPSGLQDISVCRGGLKGNLIFPVQYNLSFICFEMKCSI